MSASRARARSRRCSITSCRTAGCSGCPVSYVAADGQRFDVVGPPPDVATPVFSAEELDEERDSAIESALELLGP